MMPTLGARCRTNTVPGKAPGLPCVPCAEGMTPVRAGQRAVCECTQGTYSLPGMTGCRSCAELSKGVLCSGGKIGETWPLPRPGFWLDRTAFGHAVHPNSSHVIACGLDAALCIGASDDGLSLPTALPVQQLSITHRFDRERRVTLTLARSCHVQVAAATAAAETRACATTRAAPPAWSTTAFFAARGAQSRSVLGVSSQCGVGVPPPCHTPPRCELTRQCACQLGEP